jgi:hypothetical protein
MMGKIGQLSEWADDLWISLIENSLIDFFPSLFIDRFVRTQLGSLAVPAGGEVPLDEQGMLRRGVNQLAGWCETSTIQNLAHLVSFSIFFHDFFCFTWIPRFVGAQLG